MHSASICLFLFPQVGAGASPARSVLRPQETSWTPPAAPAAPPPAPAMPSLPPGWESAQDPASDWAVELAQGGPGGVHPKDVHPPTGRFRDFVAQLVVRLDETLMVHLKRVTMAFLSRLTGWVDGHDLFEPKRAADLFGTKPRRQDLLLQSCDQRNLE